MLHHKLAGVAGRIERLGVGVVHLVVDPRHIAEAFDLLKVEVCTEETGQRRILDDSSLVVAFVDVT